jgi:sulfite dehydrogenase (cytochrome) subunit B
MTSRAMLMALSAALLGIGGTALAAYQLPPETATLAPGLNRDVAEEHCIVCHSVDYITTQPRNLADPRKFWSAEVNKMRQVYGAPIPDEDAAKIVEYLVATYGT